MTVVINGTTGVSGVAGSASTPALIGSDADSGYYINSANEPNASVNGTAVWNAASSFGFKNRIINGNMAIDQRNAGASVTVNGFTVFTADRFYGSFRTSTGTATAQQVADAPSGFINSIKLTQASVTALAASDYYGFIQKIEGYNVADMGFGTASAKTFTLSFWVKSSVTGTYGLSFQNVNATRRSYVTTYTINAANTWEKKTVTVTGDTTGTWEVTTSSGLVIQWDLGSGTDYQTSTLNAWQTNNVVQASGATRWIATSSATWQLTGVQVEVGSTATSFDFRSYGTELQLCQRYYESDTPMVFGTGIYAGGSYGSTTCVNVYFKTPKRASPTVSLSYTNVDNATSVAVKSTGGGIGIGGFICEAGISLTSFQYNQYYLTYKASCEL